MNEKLKFEDREWNYFLNEGDLVCFAEDIPQGYNVVIGWDFTKEIDLNEYKNKIGVVKKCWSDLHAFGRGSSYLCEVDFDGKIISHFTQLFLRQNETHNK